VSGYTIQADVKFDTEGFYYNLARKYIIIIIIIGATARFEPRPSPEASASRPCSLQHSSSFSPLMSWHHPPRRPPILASAYPFAFFLLLLQPKLFL
jgi:hypothetical protein